MIRILFSLAVLVLATNCRAQKTETVFLDPNDSAANLYIVVHPPTQPYKGYLVLLPGMFQKPATVLQETELPKHAARQGLLTIIPTLKNGISSFGVDSFSQASLLEILDTVKRRYNLAGKRFFLGGFSIGGSSALKYAALAVEQSRGALPDAVFAIDAPLDFERMFNTMQRELSFPNVAADMQEESRYMMARFEKIFGGSPVEALTRYQQLSPYSYSDTSRKAVKLLAGIPIRLYTEPDIHWSLDQGIDLYGMNAFDFVALANDLRRLGSNKLQLILTTNKGYRKLGNVRHPHSWSIAEPQGLVRWLLSQKIKTPAR